MSLRRYFKQKFNLPTSSQTQLPTNVLREVNQAVTASLGCEEERNQRAGTKRKYTKSFTPEDQAKIGRYAAAVKKFKVTHSIGENTVRLFKTRYLEEIKKQKNPEAEVRGVPTLKRGRKVMLGEELDDKSVELCPGITNQWSTYWLKYCDGSW